MPTRAKPSVPDKNVKADKETYKKPIICNECTQQKARVASIEKVIELT